MKNKVKVEDSELDKTVADIHKDHGKDSLRVGITSGIVKCNAFSTRCLALDVALGVGGFPRGRVIEVYGPESSGKTTLAMTVVAEAQSQGCVAAMIDAEHALDPKYTADLGVNLDDLLFSQPDTGEQALSICEKLIASHKIGVIVVDSVAALTPKEVLQGEMGEHTIGAQARLMSQALAKLKGLVRRSNTCVIFINQLRDRIGMMMPGVSPEQTPGGRALKFYASVRCDIRRIGSLKEAETKVGNATRVKIVKNKVAPPFREAEFSIIFGKGISTAGSILDMAILHTLVEKSGANLSYNGAKLGVGYSTAVKFLEQNQDLLKELDTKLRAMLLPKPTLEDDGDGSEDNE